MCYAVLDHRQREENSHRFGLCQWRDSFHWDAVLIV